MIGTHHSLILLKLLTVNSLHFTNRSEELTWLTFSSDHGNCTVEIEFLNPEISIG